DPLAWRDPAHGGRMPALRAGQGDELTAELLAVADEHWRGQRRLRLGLADMSWLQRPLKASRRREQKPRSPGENRPGGDSSPRDLASCLSSSSCSGSSLTGVSTVTWITRSPRPGPCKCDEPWPYSGMVCPDWVPGLISIVAGPSSVWIWSA